jgi:rubrerythrin
MGIEAEIFFALLAGIVIAGVFAAWLACEHRAARFYDRQLTRHIFHCLKCGHLYANEGKARLSKCPRCNLENPRLSF